jgi:formylmethanofuran--tetrahydromethanopterin N-formyltransferase
MVDDRIEDTYAEAFEMTFTRLVVTAIDRQWLDLAAREFCGYGTSVIGCDAEAGVEQSLEEAETPDGRPGMALLVFAFSSGKLARAVVNRAGQCLMTCPTTAVFNGLHTEKTLGLGRQLRYFGDGFQKSKKRGPRRYWRVPVMDGEFVCEESCGVARGVAGGNFIVQGTAQAPALRAAMAAVGAIAGIPGCITPFPGGIARSGSKVGSRYRNQVASTADAWCPTLRGRVPGHLHPQASAAYEVVIDGVDEAAVRRAMRVGIEAALDTANADQVVRVAAGNYGGKLGKCLIPLPSLFAD